MNNIEKKNTAKATGPKAHREYAIYKGDEFITIGTARECAEQLGVSQDTIRFYSSPAYAKRVEHVADKAIIAVALMDEEKEQR